MGYRVITEPASEPLTLAEAKALPRVTTSDDDALLTRLIIAARKIVETRTWLSLITQTIELTLRDFPIGRRPILLPRGPIQSIESIEYVDAEGVTQELAEFQTSLNSEPPCIEPAYDDYWPIARKQPAAVTITFVAGFGDAGTDVPEHIRHAMRLLIAELYDYAEPRPHVTRAVDSLLQSDHGRDARLAEFVTQ